MVDALAGVLSDDNIAIATKPQNANSSKAHTIEYIVNASAAVHPELNVI